MPGHLLKQSGSIYGMGSPGMAGGGAWNAIQNILGSSLIGYWKLDDKSGLVAQDTTTNNRDGAYSAAGVTYGETGIGDRRTCIKLNGTTGFVNLRSPSLDAAWNGDEFTIGVFIMPSSAGMWTDGSYRNAIRIYVNGNNYVYVSTNGAGTFFADYRGGGGTSRLFSMVMSDAGWTSTFVSVSRAANTSDAYVAGSKMMPTKPASGAWAGTPSYMLVGAQTTVPAQAWDGWAAHAFIANRVITPAEALSLNF